LMTSHKLSADSKTRIETMVRTNDGFWNCRSRLKTSRPRAMGTQQSGVLNLQMPICKRSEILWNFPARNA
jgi:ATP-dependent DNA helicase RecG